jgi:hypothetical protein
MCRLLTRFFIALGGLGLLTVVSCYEHDSKVPANQDLAGQDEGVVFRFIECAGKWSVFGLENRKDQPVYAQVERVDYWEEYRKADMELGVHFVEKVPPYEKGFPRNPWDAPPQFRAISPHTIVRYAVITPTDGNRYKVQVPYLEDSDLAERLNKDFPSVLKNDFEKLGSSWRYVYSDENTGQCE